MKKWFSFFKNIISVISAAIGVVFVFFPLSETTSSNIMSRFWIILGIAVLAVLLSVAWTIYDKKQRCNKVYASEKASVSFEYGDMKKLFEASKDLDEVTTFVIPVNTKLEVSSELRNLSNKSLHHWALEKIGEKVDCDFIKGLTVKSDGFTFETDEDGVKGKKGDWFLIPREKMNAECNANFLFIEAFDLVDKNGQWANEKIEVDEYLVVLQKMIEAISDNLQHEAKVYLPLIGAGAANVGKSEDILQLMANLLRFNRSKLNQEIHVIIDETKRTDIPIHQLERF